MPCPACGVVGVTTVCGGGWILFVRDRLRRTWRMVALLLVALWYLYFEYVRGDKVALRSLEVLSVLLLLSAFARVGWLMLTRGMMPPGFMISLRLHRWMSPVTMQPVTMSLKMWLAVALSLRLVDGAQPSYWDWRLPVIGLGVWLVLLWLAPSLRYKVQEVVEKAKEKASIGKLLVSSRLVALLGVWFGVLVVYQLSGRVELSQFAFALPLLLLLVTGAMLVAWHYYFAEPVKSWIAKHRYVADGAVCPFGFSSSS